MKLIEFACTLLLEGLPEGEPAQPPDTREGVDAFLSQAAYIALRINERLGPQTLREIIEVGPIERAAWDSARERLEIERAQKIGTAAWGPGGVALLESRHDGGQALAEVRVNENADRIASEVRAEYQAAQAAQGG